MKKLLLTMLLVACNTIMMFAQQTTDAGSYNFLRGVEEVLNYNYSDALKYLNKDIEENPTNGYAYAYIASAYYNTDKYGEALTAAQKALKYLPKDANTYRALAYNTRGSVYLELKDTVQALADFTSQIEADPEMDESYSTRGNIYVMMGEYDLAIADF